MKTKRIIAAAVLIVGSGLALPRTRWCIFVDAHGRIRYHQLGEGACDQAEHVIQHLLTEAGAGSVPNDLVSAVETFSFTAHRRSSAKELPLIRKEKEP